MKFNFFDGIVFELDWRAIVGIGICVLAFQLLQFRR